LGSLCDVNCQASRKRFKYAAEKGIAVVIMEPLRGGNLAGKIPEQNTLAWKKKQGQQIVFRVVNVKMYVL